MQFSFKRIAAWVIFLFLFIGATYPDKSSLRSSHTNIDFGHSKTKQTIYLTNTGTDSVAWNAKTLNPWVHIEPAFGTIENAENLPANAPYYHSKQWPESSDYSFLTPEAVGIDHEGNIYVLSLGSRPIKKFNRYEELVMEAGSYDPDDPGYLYKATRIAFDSKNNFYVADIASRVIKKFDKNGQFLNAIALTFNDNNSYDIDVAVDSNGNLYVTDRNHFCISKFDPDGNFIKSWGSQGLGDGQFDNKARILGIAIDSNDNIFVADNHYYRIQKFDTEGNFIKKWFVKPEGEQFVEQRQDASIFCIDPNDVIYVGSNDSEFLTKFDSEGNHIPENWVDPSGGYLQEEDYISLGNAAVNKDGFIYLPVRHGIFKYDQQGLLVEKLKNYGKETNLFYWPVGMTVDNAGNIYVRDENKQIRVLNADCQLMRDIDISAIPDQLINFRVEAALAVDSQGNIYIGQGVGKGALFKFSASGQLLATWRNDNFKYIKSLAVDSRDNLYARTEWPNLLLKLDADGNIIQQKDISQVNNNYISSAGLAIDAQDNIYITDTTYGFFKFDPQFNLIREFRYVAHVNKEDKCRGSGNYVSAAIDTLGNIYILFETYEEIHKYDSNGNLLTAWGRIGSDEGGFLMPNGIAAGQNGDIYVSEHGNKRIQIFSQAVTPVSISIDRTKLTEEENISGITFYDENNPQTSADVFVGAKQEFGVLTGRVYTSLSRKIIPVPRAYVLATKLDSGSIVKRVLTDRSGVYTLNDLLLGRYRVIVWKPGLGYSQPVIVKIIAGKTTRANLLVTIRERPFKAFVY